MAAFGKAQYIKCVEDDRSLTGTGGAVGSLGRFPTLCNVSDDFVPARTNPSGAKGVGESGTVGSTPIAMNAIMDALWPLGLRNIRMPANPQCTWQAISNPGK